MFRFVWYAQPPPSLPPSSLPPGGRWQRIPAPRNIANPACDRCGGASACFLHLHGLSAWDNMGSSLPAVYSNPSAPGLVMATGNVAPLGVGLDGNDG